MEDYFSPKVSSYFDNVHDHYNEHGELEIIPNDHDNYYPYGPQLLRTYDVQSASSPSLSPPYYREADAPKHIIQQKVHSASLAALQRKNSSVNHHGAALAARDSPVFSRRTTWPQRNPGLRIPDIAGINATSRFFYPPPSLTTSPFSPRSPEYITRGPRPPESPRNSFGWPQSPYSLHYLGSYDSSQETGHLRNNLVLSPTLSPQSQKEYCSAVPPAVQTFGPVPPGVPSSNNSGFSERLGPNHVNAEAISFFDRANAHFYSPVQNVVGNVSTTIYQSPHITPIGRDILRLLMAPNALHSCRGEYNERLRCHPETRLCITRDIDGWVLDPKRSRGILWMTGPPGTGKSAIARTSAENLDIEHHALAASFFFWRQDDTRNTPRCFVPTIADRLAVWNDGISKYLDDVLRRDPFILDGNMSYQWRKLVIEPVLATPGLSPAVIIVDGLDECGSPRDQEEILKLISTCSTIGTFPIAFLISSRPESHLKTAFDHDVLRVLCRERIMLGDTTESRRDMRLYLASGFTAIRRRNRAILGSELESWPPEEVYDRIIEYSSGQFIYPTIVLTFIDDDNRDPRVRLDQILNSQEAAESGAFSSIDVLYHVILKNSGFLQTESIPKILFLLLVPTQPRRMYSMSQNFTKFSWITHIVEQNMSSIRFALRRLHSVLDIPDADTGGPCIRYYHRSFGDFLLDYRRSQEYFIDISHHSALIAIRALETLSNASYESNWDTSEFINASLVWIFFSCYVERDWVPEQLVQAMDEFNFAAWLDAYAKQPYSLCDCFDEFIYHIRTWPLFRTNSLPSSSRAGELSLLDHARFTWYTELCSGNDNLAKLYYLFLVTIIPKGATLSWTGINVLVNIYQQIYSERAFRGWPIKEGLSVWTRYDPQGFYATLDKSLQLQLAKGTSTGAQLEFTRGSSRNFAHISRVMVCIIAAITEDTWRSLLPIEDVLRLLACDWDCNISHSTMTDVSSYDDIKCVVPGTFEGFHGLLSLERHDSDEFSLTMPWRLAKASYLSGEKRVVLDFQESNSTSSGSSVLGSWKRITALHEKYL